MASLPFQRQLRCNLSATLVLALWPSIAAAQPSSVAEPAQQAEPRVADTVKFLAGGAGAFVAHETGHLLFDALFDAHPFLRRTQFGPFPFVAIDHEPISPRREFIVSSAGFWTQEAASEWLLTRRPGLRQEHAPLEKGVLAFDVLASLGYGLVALARAGPIQRDTHGMTATGIDERAIGLIVIAPAALDAYRYFTPGSRWAKWASRAVKAGSVLLIAK